jgi:hypothetical protein
MELLRHLCDHGIRQAYDFVGPLIEISVERSPQTGVSRIGVEAGIEN